MNNPNGDRRWSWIQNGWLEETGSVSEQFGGDEWVRSPKSWKNLGNAEKGNIVFCHQTDLKGLVGLTIAASGGYPFPKRSSNGPCTSIDLGPQRVAFEYVVTVPEIRAAIGSKSMAAYAPGDCQHTFHVVEPSVFRTLVKLCCKVNPAQKRQIERLCNAKK